MFNQAYVSIKSHEGLLKSSEEKENEWSQRKQNQSRVASGEGRVDFINDAYEIGLEYWKRADLESVSTENEARELIELAPRKVILVCKAKNQKFINVEQLIFHLKSQYLEHNCEDRTFIPNIPSEEPSFEAIANILKTFSKSIKEDENLGL